MVSIQLGIIKFLLIYRYLQNAYWFKRGILTVTRPTSEASSTAHVVRTSNTEAHADMYNPPSAYLS